MVYDTHDIPIVDFIDDELILMDDLDEDQKAAENQVSPHGISFNLEKECEVEITRHIVFADTPEKLQDNDHDCTDHTNPAGRL